MNLPSYALYPHQTEGVEFLARRGRAIPGDDSGPDKTRQTSIAPEESTASGVVHIICPALLKLRPVREMRPPNPDACIEVLDESSHARPLCPCPDVEHRGECKHLRDVRKTPLAN